MPLALWSRWDCTAIRCISKRSYICCDRPWCENILSSVPQVWIVENILFFCHTMDGLARCLHSSSHLISNQSWCVNRWTVSKENGGFESPRSVMLFYLLTANWTIAGSLCLKLKLGPSIFSSIHYNEHVLKLLFHSSEVDEGYWNNFTINSRRRIWSCESVKGVVLLSRQLRKLTINSPFYLETYMNNQEG